MTALHTEKALEDEICHDLAAARWLHDAADAARYDRALALFPDDVVGWIQTTQPEAWSSIEQTHGANARKVDKQLRQAKLPTQVQTVGTNKGEYTRVRAGPFRKASEARAAARRIRAMGLDAVVFQQR